MTPEEVELRFGIDEHLARDLFGKSIDVRQVKKYLRREYPKSFMIKRRTAYVACACALLLAGCCSFLSLVGGPSGIYGSVQLPDGSPAPGAKVWLYASELKPIRTTTDSAGAFSFPNPPPASSYCVIAYSPGSAPAATSGVPRDRKAPLVFCLSPGVTMTGVIRTEDGRPVEGVVVRVAGKTFAQLPDLDAAAGHCNAELQLGIDKAITGSDGRFTIHDLIPGLYNAEYYKDGFKFYGEDLNTSVDNQVVCEGY